MKKILLNLALILGAFHVQAQAPIPTSWACEGTTPADWTLDLGADPFYTSATACAGAGSLKINATGESATLFIGGQPGLITFQIRGQVGPGTTSWSGTFNVEESVNGSTWTTIESYGNGMLNINSCQTENLTPTNPASRYIRWHFANKVSGNNVNVDEISIASPSISEARLKVFQLPNNNDVLHNGTTLPISTSSVDFTLENEGTAESLSIDSILFSGSNASDFAVTAPVGTFSIAASSNDNLSVAFNAGGVGTRTAVMHIYSNDIQTPVYIVNLYAVNGVLSTEPIQQISNSSFPINKTYRLGMSFNALNQGVLDYYGGYLVIRSENSPADGIPSDGIVYGVGQALGNGKVVFAGQSDGSQINFNPRFTVANKTYHFTVFTYNGIGSFINYNTVNAHNASITTPATMVNSNEYAGIVTSNSTLVDDLHNLINPHDMEFYSNYASTMINLFTSRDTLATIGAFTYTKVVDCVYSGEKKLYNEPFDWTALDYSREHTYPKSWMLGQPVDSPTEKPQYNDQHNLYPTRQTSVNARRCNYPLGEVVTSLNPPLIYLDCELGLDANGNRVFEPRDEHKGRAARALMYMAVCYSQGDSLFSFNNPNGQVCAGGSSINYSQDQNLMKKWHFDYPPDAFDMARNDFLDSLQENRNPFVDQPDLACYIDFSTLQHIANPPTPCYTIGLNDLDEAAFEMNLYPNPTSMNSTLTFALGKAEKCQVEIFDLTGKQVRTSSLNGHKGLNQITIPTNELSNGIYTMRLIVGKEVAQQLLVVSK